MYLLDFFSESSRHNSFYQKEEIKTGLGGFLSIIFLLFFLFISIFYIADYSLNDKYEIQSLTIFNMTTMEEIEKMSEDLDLNPELDFYFELVDWQGNPLSTRFELYDLPTSQILERSEDNYYHIKTRVSNLYLSVAYYCDFNECQIEDEDNWNLFLKFRIYYQAFNLTHQDENCPMQKSIDSYFVRDIPFHMGYPTKTFLTWENIKYKEEKDIFSLLNFNKAKKEYIGGYIDSYEEIILDNNQNLIVEGKSKSVIASFSIVNDFHKYIEYTRRKKGKWDIVAKIAALVSITKVILAYLYEFSSNNYYKYKVLENLFYNKKIKMNFNEPNNDYKGFDFDDLDNIDIANDNPSNENNNKKIVELTKSPPLIDKINIKKQSFINNENINYDNEIEENKIMKSYPRMNFVSYLFCRNCKKYQKNKKLISLCDNILFKYLSVDSVLYNQIIFDNLFKDNKWNEQNLNRIESSELINKSKDNIKQ